MPMLDPCPFVSIYISPSPTRPRSASHTADPDGDADLTGPVTVFDIGLAESVMQRCFADAEIGADLLDGDAALTATGDHDNVFAELSGIGTGRDDILPASASRH